MKKLIFRRFSLDITNFFLLAILSIGLIVWIIQAVNYLDFVSEDGHSLKVYFMYSILSLPKIIGKLTIFVFFISVFFISLASASVAVDSFIKSSLLATSPHHREII